MAKNAYVLCLGCPESRIDTAKVQNFLKENGWNITDDLKKADVILFRSCGLTEKEVEDSLRVIRTIKSEKKPDAQFIVWGCLPKIDPEALKTEYEGISFGEKEIGVLNEIFAAKKPVEEVAANCLLPVFELDRPGFFGSIRKLTGFAGKYFDIAGSGGVFLIKISTGCVGNCSFCAVRKSRGVVQSKSVESILSEFRDGLRKGFRYFGLLGTDIGAYGKDRGTSLAKLLAEIIKEKGNCRIGLRNLNPYHLNEMLEELKPIFSSGKIWFLSAAVESGSNRILKLMRRRYTVEGLRRCIKMIKEEYPNIVLRTQMMVGFPTETEKDFRDSMRLLDELKFDWVEVYRFSNRPGTEAATMKGQIPGRIKEARFRRLFFKAMIKSPHKKVKHIVKSYLESKIPAKQSSELSL